MCFYDLIPGRSGKRLALKGERVYCGIEKKERCHMKLDSLMLQFAERTRESQEHVSQYFQAIYAEIASFVMQPPPSPSSVASRSDLGALEL